MIRAGEVLQIAAPFVWLGMVLAISALETPLKFRAPGITRPLGLGIGRLVFRALNAAELVLSAMLTVALIGTPGAFVTLCVTALWIILLLQVVGLRPALDRRAKLIMKGETVPRSSLHHLYVGLETVKVVLLATVGTSLTLRLVA